MKVIQKKQANCAKQAKLKPKKYLTNKIINVTKI